MAFETTAILDDSEIQSFLRKLKAKSLTIEKNQKTLAGLFSIPVFQDIMAHFKKEEGSGGSWAPWSTKKFGNFPSYAEKMAEKGRTGKLKDTGKLRDSFLPGSYRIKENAIVFFNPAKVKGGFPYAFAHNEGGPILPKRDFMWLSDVAQKKILSQTLKWISDVG